MKNTFKKIINLTCCTLAIGFAGVASSSYAGAPYALQQINTPSQASALKPGSEVVMTCAKCKTVQVAQVDRKGGIPGWFQPKTKHMCQGCGGEMHVSTVAGGKATSAHYAHVCSKCGSGSAFCCGTAGGKM